MILTDQVFDIELPLPLSGDMPAMWEAAPFDVPDDLELPKADKDFKNLPLRAIEAPPELPKFVTDLPVP